MSGLLAELQDGFEAESAALQGLLDVLEAEREILLKPGVEGLDVLLERKTAAVNQVSALTQQRYSLLAASGFTADEQGMQACLSGFSENPAGCELERTWKALGAMAQKVKTGNQSNGQLVSYLLGRNRELLTVFGLAAREGGGLYGPDGRTSQFGKSLRHFPTG
jgi:flagella synthesis protein FlgN